MSAGGFYRNVELSSLLWRGGFCLRSQGWPPARPRLTALRTETRTRLFRQLAFSVSPLICALLQTVLTLITFAVFGLCLAPPVKGFSWPFLDNKRAQPQVCLLNFIQAKKIGQGNGEGGGGIFPSRIACCDYVDEADFRVDRRNKRLDYSTSACHEHKEGQSETSGRFASLLQGVNREARQQFGRSWWIFAATLRHRRRCLGPAQSLPGSSGRQRWPRRGGRGQLPLPHRGYS